MLLDPDIAKELILARTTTKAPQSVALEESFGRVLSEDIRASAPVPPFDNSAMDGYAVRREDLAHASAENPVILKKVDYIPAGTHEAQTLPSGHCYQIATGAEIPPGADAVEMKENTSVEGNEVHFTQCPRPEQFIRFRGEDIQAGASVLPQGATITPGRVSVLATFGYSRVPVYATPNVVAISTGSELLEIEQSLQPGKIHDSNSYMLSAMVQDVGANCHRVGIVQDDETELQEAFQQHLQADVLLISGGVSVGDRDFVKDILKELGVEEIFWKVNIKPGKPFFFGKREDCLVFGLPGNPASSYVIFEEFVRPALRKMMGFPVVRRPLINAINETKITERASRRQFLRAHFYRDGDQYRVRAMPLQGSHSIRSIAGASGLIVVPENSEEIPAGATVKVRPLVAEDDF